MRIDTFEYNGYEATVIIPDAPNGKWIWKTEFLYAFDNAERELCNLGYTRVYYAISNKYGSYKAVRLMRDFYSFVKSKYSLTDKCTLFGFSRGGLYAFNFALSHPEYVNKIYLDAPVMCLRSWPPEGSPQRMEVYKEYSLTPETLEHFCDNPIDNLAEFFSHGIPVMLVAGDEDEIVPFEENSKIMLDFALERSYDIKYVIKPNCKHHPHSLEDVSLIIDFVTDGAHR